MPREPTSPAHIPTRPVRRGRSQPRRSRSSGCSTRRLIEAAWDNDVRRARRLIDRGADVNWRDESVQSAFLIATSEGYLDLLELTLARGADVTLHDSFDGTGLIRAAERGHWDIVGRLLQTRIAVDHVNNLGVGGPARGDHPGRRFDALRRHGACPGRGWRLAPDHARARRDRAGRARSVAAARPPSCAPWSGRSTHPTSTAPSEPCWPPRGAGDADAAAIALRQGADVEVRDGAGRTPLLIAVTEDRLAVARLLVAMGASPDALDDRHDTPWLVTGVTGSVPMAELLLRFDPDLTIRNRYGGVSIIPAAERGHVGYVRASRGPGSTSITSTTSAGPRLLEAIILGDGSPATWRSSRSCSRPRSGPDRLPTARGRRRSSTLAGAEFSAKSRGCWHRAPEPGAVVRRHSTVTDFARLRGLSMSCPRCRAAW